MLCLRTTMLAAICGMAAMEAQTPTGIFEAHSDVGINPKAGSVEYDAASGHYRITGGGANVWGAEDAFRFAWKRISGDFVLTADVRFIGEGVNAHRKVMLMARQDLTAGSPYADVALHGDGLTSLQFRSAPGGPTQQLQSSAKAPVRIRLERRGDAFTLYAGNPEDTALTSTGPQVLKLSDPVYVGIGVCSHDATVLETAVVSNVRLEQQAPRVSYRSKISIYDVAKRSVEQVYEGEGVIEAPNWSRDGRFLLVNTNGNLYRLPVTGGSLEKISLGDGTYRCNNDHDFSPDGQQIAFSASSPSSRQSQVFVARADGTDVRLLTPLAPSYFHGWSPDGKWLAFVGQRDKKYELFRVSVNGGSEERLTSKGAYDDGPEYSPDGRWIYFNSNRSGGWDLWRMPAQGAGAGDTAAEQITRDDLEDWFPHISPNGKQMVFLSFPKGTAGHNDRIPGMKLRLMPVPGRAPTAQPISELLTFFGGQGSINVNSWSPDSKRFAFVAYEPVAAVMQTQTRFQTEEIATGLGVVYAVTTADVNKDGRPDVVAINNTQLLWFENSGKAGAPWSKHVVTEKVTQNDNVTVAPLDIDRDGKLDFALGADWQPANTASGGSLHWVTQDGKVQNIAEEPTLHRIRWGDVTGDGKDDLIVVPLHERGTKAPDWKGPGGVRILVFQVPANPTSSWPVEVADESLHITHNFIVVNGEIWAAGAEGVFALSRSKDGKWTKRQLAQGNPGEIKLGRIDGKRYLATVEPWHGTKLVAYQEAAPLWQRVEVDPALNQGHALGWGDFDGDGSDELVAGYRGKPWALNLYKRAKDGTWSKTLIDDGVAVEDLAVADLNGDGRPDIVAGGRTTQNIRIYFGTKP